MNKILTISGFLAVKEIWRNRGRFLLVSLVIALITLLVLFIAALGEGLGNGNREYISKLDAELIVYQAQSDLLIAASRLGLDRLADIRRVEGVQDAGLLGTSNVNLVLPEGVEPLRVAMLGIDPGHTGEPPVVEGQQISTDLAEEAIIDSNTALRSGIQLGDILTIRVTQGTQEEYFDLRVVGVTDGQQYALQPSIFVPFNTWDRIRPKSEAEVNNPNPVANVILVKLADPAQVGEVSQRLTAQVDNIEPATIDEAIQALPGYSAQQSTLQTQGAFTLFIGVLVIGGFFQIQILQKVPQIGVLKAIGTANPVVAMASVLQIFVVTIIGVAIGGLLTFLFSLTFPPTVPIVFNGTRTLIAVAALLLIGPIGGLVSVRYAVRIEPLKALGLSS
jgi:putative ABC transport system permease protein